MSIERPETHPWKFDECVCGELKRKRAMRCDSCSRHGAKDAPAVKNLHYFPKCGRYALLAVTGYNIPAGDTYGCTFTIIDQNDCWREVHEVRCSGAHINSQRWSLVQWIKRENKRERELAA